MEIVPKAQISFLPIFRILKLLAFHPRMFRRRPRDETILCCTKPFSPFGADIPKPSLINNPPNETPVGVGIGSLSCRTSSPLTPQPSSRLPPPARRQTKCCCRVLPGRPHV